MVQRLLEAGARSTIKNWKRKTAVDIAREKGRHEIAQLIENGLPQVEDTGLTKSAR